MPTAPVDRMHSAFVKIEVKYFTFQMIQLCYYSVHHTKWIWNANRKCEFTDNKTAN